MIHKEGKGPTECSCYRPIELQNSDCKILTTILEKRLKSGFSVGRQLSDDIHRILNVMSHAKSMPVPCMALALDAKQSFDSVSRPFLLKV